MKRFFLLASLLLPLIGCTAKEPTVESAASAPTKLDLLNRLMEKAERQAGAIKEFGQPRIVKRGATPEIIIKGTEIRFNGHALSLGGNITEWNEILGPRHRDHWGFTPTSTWDDLGIEVVINHQDKKTVTQITIYFNRKPEDPYAGMVTHGPDGKPLEPIYDSSPKQTFKGYFELDGVGIDARSKFWELRTQIGSTRKLDCGLHNCTHPVGGFSEAANLYLRLNRGDEYGEIITLSISGDVENLKAALRNKK